jgi:hypothetical protein
VGLSTLRKRAAEEGWRRTDQPWSRPNGLERDDEGLALEEQFDGDLDQIPLGELSLVAFQRMMRAVLHGKAMEALRWRRVYKAIEAEAAEVRRRQQQAERERSQAARREVRDFGDAVVMAAREDYETALARWKRGEPIDGIDGIDGVFPPSPESAPSPGVLPGLPGGAALAGAP